MAVLLLFALMVFPNFVYLSYLDVLFFALTFPLTTHPLPVLVLSWVELMPMRNTSSSYPCLQSFSTNKNSHKKRGGWCCPSWHPCQGWTYANGSFACQHQPSYLSRVLLQLLVSLALIRPHSSSVFILFGRRSCFVLFLFFLWPLVATNNMDLISSTLQRKQLYSLSM